MSGLYRPTIQVLHVEDRQRYWKPLRKELIARGIFVHTVHTLADAVDVLKTCDVQLLVSDGMFPRKKGLREWKSFIPLQEKIKALRLTVPPITIAWANSTHVHEYCEKHGLAHFSKIELKPHHFERRGRTFFPVTCISPSDLAALVQNKLLEISGIEHTYGTLTLNTYYTEPATVFAIFMASDMRTALFKETAGVNYGPMASVIKDGVFSLLIDDSNDAVIAKSIFKKIKDQNYFPIIKKHVDAKAKQLLAFARKLRRSSHKKKSNAELARLYLKFVELFMGMRMYSSLPTALEHGTNIWTKHLTDILRKKIHDRQALNKALSALTTPERYSYLKLYEHDLARIATAPASKRTAMIKKLIETYAWIRYAFQGAPITAKDVRAQIMERTSDAWEKVLEGEKSYAKEVKKNKYEITRAAHLDEREQEYFEIGADIVFIKYFRKGVFAESYYCVEFLFKEIARRIGVERDDVSQMTAQEVLAALRVRSFPKELLKGRWRNGVLFHYDGKTSACASDAKRFLQRAGDAVNDKQELAGQVAYPGNVRGRARIINPPSELSQFQRGEIMVSRSTNPALISAMEKAAAIVTDLGGLTCHAAIVAREMKKPCVVGTKHATVLLKDGDMIVVDAEKGMITKI